MRGGATSRNNTEVHHRPVEMASFLARAAVCKDENSSCKFCFNLNRISGSNMLNKGPQCSVTKYIYILFLYFLEDLTQFLEGISTNLRMNMNG